MQACIFPRPTPGRAFSAKRQMAHDWEGAAIQGTYRDSEPQVRVAVFDNAVTH